MSASHSEHVYRVRYDRAPRTVAVSHGLGVRSRYPIYEPPDGFPDYVVERLEPAYFKDTYKWVKQFRVRSPSDAEQHLKDLREAEKAEEAKKRQPPILFFV